MYILILYAMADEDSSSMQVGLYRRKAVLHALIRALQRAESNDPTHFPQHSTHCKHDLPRCAKLERNKGFSGTTVRDRKKEISPVPSHYGMIPIVFRTSGIRFGLSGRAAPVLAMQACDDPGASSQHDTATHRSRPARPPDNFIVQSELIPYLLVPRHESTQDLGSRIHRCTRCFFVFLVF